MTLEVQKYLRSGKTIEDLNNELGIMTAKHPVLPFVILNYNQIESPKTDKIVRECRGLVLHSDTYDLVARSFSRFFNWGEVQEEMKNFDFSNFIVQEKIDGCFQYNTTLNIWGGGTIRIGKVVSKKLKPTLIGMDENGKIVPCEIIDYFDNGTKDNWLEITVDCHVSPSISSAGKPNKIKVTSNHSIYSGERYVLAKDLRIGDWLTNFEYIPSKSVIHMIEASLLGDASIISNGNNHKFVDGHKVSHIEFINQIEYWLGSCAIKTRNRISGYGTKMLDVTSKTSNFYSSLRKKWYPDGEKIVPQDLSWMDNFAVAKWYMDDGSLSSSDKQQDRAIFSTHCFLKSDVERLAIKLQEMYDIDAVLAVDNRHKDKRYIRINSGIGSKIDNFWQAIAPHIVSCMKYKLPVKFRNVKYIPYPKGVEKIICKKVKILDIKKLSNTKTVFPSGRKGFDIKTTTGNYFAKGVLVHNSLSVIYYHDNSWHINTRGSFALDFMQFQTFTWREAMLKAMNLSSINELDQHLNNKLTYICEFVGPYNKVVRRYDQLKMYLLSAFEGHRELNYVELDGHYPDVKHLFHRPEVYEFRSIEEIQDFLKVCAGTWEIGEEEGVCVPIQEGKDPTFEGVVIRDRNNNRYKVKSSRYLSLHRMAGNGNLFNPKYLLPWVLSGEKDELLTYFNEVEEKYLEVEKSVKESYDQLVSVWKDNWQIESQKDFALAIVKKTPFSSILFQLRKEHGTKQTEQLLKKKWLDSEDQILKTLFK